MTNNMIVSINLAFLAISCVILPGAMQLDKKRGDMPLFTLFYISLIFWQAIETLLFILKNPWWIRYLYDIKLIGVTCVAVLFSLLIIRFFQLEELFDKKNIFFLWIIPIITTVLCLTTTLHPFIRTNLQIVQIEPLLEVVNERGFWFYVHTIYCTLLVIVMLVLSIVRLIKVPTVYRTGPFWLTIVLSVMIAGALIDMFKIRFVYLDFFLIGASIAGILYYLANIIDERSNYLFFERRELFNYLDKAILIINDNGFIADSNRAATKWLQMFGVTDTDMRFEPFIKQLEHNGKIKRQPAASSTDEDIIIDNNGYPVTYHLQRFSMEDERYGGYTITMEDVTRARLASERLLNIAEKPLDCRTHNTNYYENLLHCLDIEKQLPLGVIMVGVQEPTINLATAAHHKATVEQAMQAMRKNCPDRGCITQIGAYKFVALLPDCTQDMLKTHATHMIDQLNCELDPTDLSKLSIGWKISNQVTNIQFTWESMDNIQRTGSQHPSSEEAYNGK